MIDYAKFKEKIMTFRLRPFLVFILAGDLMLVRNRGYNHYLNLACGRRSYADRRSQSLNPLGGHGIIHKNMRVTVDADLPSGEFRK